MGRGKAGPEVEETSNSTKNTVREVIFLFLDRARGYSETHGWKESHSLGGNEDGGNEGTGGNLGFSVLPGQTRIILVPNKKVQVLSQRAGS